MAKLMVMGKIMWSNSLGPEYEIRYDPSSSARKWHVIERGDIILIKNDRIGREAHYVSQVEILEDDDHGLVPQEIIVTLKSAHTNKTNFILATVFGFKKMIEQGSWEIIKCQKNS